VIGRDEKTVRRWERTHLAPALSVGDDATHRFDLARVRELIEVRERTTRTTPDSFDDGDTTAAVFSAFAQGVSAVDVIIRQKLPASAVESLGHRYIRLRGGYVVDEATARSISALRRAAIFSAEPLEEPGGGRTPRRTPQSVR
jgi:hypothetical protein